MTKTTLLKLAVIVSTIFFLASCTFKYHAHTMTKIEAKASTCTTKGNIDHYRCRKCGATFSDENGQNPLLDVTIPVDPSAHSLTHHPAIAATLEKEGFSKENWECALCGKFFSDEGCTTETTLAALVIPKGFAKLNAGTVTVSIGDANGPFGNASSTPVPVNEFYMAMTETTYERWYEVYTWAITNKYTFVYKGREGTGGTDGASPTLAGQKEPVTYISWRDAVVWCNAASEKDGKTPVYYVTTDFTSSNVLRQSDTSWVMDGNGEAEKAVINENANGYRLPTEAEWEYAARGGNPNSTEWGYTYAGTNSESDLGDYAVYGVRKPTKVGTKTANSAGLYDMCGNLSEWCWDIMYSDGAQKRVLRSSNWGSSSPTVASRDSGSPSALYSSSGFRICYVSGSN